MRTSQMFFRLVILALMVFPSSVSAQVRTGTVIGSVRDQSDSPLPGVTATLASPALATGPIVVTTAMTGEFRFTSLPPGTYSLTLALAGFATYQEDDLRVTVGGTIERNATLRVSTLQEIVTVTGSSPMVDVRQVNLEHTVTNEYLENLPTLRGNIQEFAKWTPGVTNSGGNSQAISALGSTYRENSYLIDGININNPRSGGFFQNSDFDSVQEVQISTLGASAEYAIAQGAVVNTISKSGTNVLSGTATAVFEPDAFVSEPNLLNCNCPAGRTGYRVLGYKDYSAHGGGPIIKDHLWYFGGGMIVGTKSVNPGGNPSAAGWNTAPKVSSKITWKISDRLQLNEVLNWEAYRSSGGAGTVTNPPSTLTFLKGWTPTYGTELTDQLSRSTLLTIHVSGWGEADSRTFPGPLGDITTPNHLDLRTSIQSGGVQQFSVRHQWRNSQSAKVNHFRQGASLEQELRGGAQFDQGTYDEAFSYPSGVQYQDINGAPNQAIFREPWVQGASYNWQADWAEDQLTIKNRLTLNLGVRWDRIEARSQDIKAVDTLLHRTGSTVKGLGKLFTWNDTSPRIGFNLKLTDDGKTIVRGNVNRAYRAALLDDFANLHPGISPITLRSWDPAAASYSTVVSVTDPRANIALDTALKPPFTNQYSIGLDRQLTNMTAVSATFVRKHGERQVGWTDVGGVYGTRADVLPNGQTLTVLPLLNAPSARKFTLTNGPGFFNTYNGVVLSVSKRMSQHWQAEASLAQSKTRGLMIGAAASLAPPIVGQDPNDYINLAGRISPLDRPTQVQVMTTFDVAPLGVLLAINSRFESGLPYAPVTVVQLPQGSRSVNVAPPGSGDFRFPPQKTVNLRMSKTIVRRNATRLEVVANVYNVLQNKAVQSFLTLNYFSPTFGQPASWIQPRFANLMVKMSW